MKTKTNWITLNEAMSIVRLKSRNGFKRFARRHRLYVNRRTRKHLFREHEVLEALDRGCVRLG